MFRLTQSQVQPIGLDLGHDSVKLLQLEVVGNTLAVHAAARGNLPAEVRQNSSLRVPAASDIVRRLLQEGGFSGRRVVATLPREIIHVKNLRLPMMPPAELESAALFEARNVFAFDTDHAQIRLLPVGEVRQGTDTLQEVVLLAARDEDVDTFVEQIHRCGVIVDSLDIEAAALYRTIERFIRRREDEQEINVVVDLGVRHSQVVIGKGREVQFLKSLDFGGAELNEAVARKLSITADEACTLRRRLSDTPAVAADGDSEQDPVRQAVYDAGRQILEDLGREIGLCLRYHSVTFRGHRPARVRLAGGEGCDTQVQAVLNSVLPIPAEAGKPLMSVNTEKMKPEDRRGTMTEWSLAFGLGLRRTTGKFGARDGKPRDPNAPRVEPAPKVPSIAQTVDIHKAVEAAALPAPMSAAAAEHFAAVRAESRGQTPRAPRGDFRGRDTSTADAGAVEDAHA